MSLPVHLVDSLAGVAVGDVVTVDGDEGRHAVAVRRLAVDEQVVITDGLGTSATGTIRSTQAKRSMDVVVDSVDVAPPLDPTFTVAQALPKGERGELAVEMMTEIGVSTVMPWAATRSIVSWRGERGVKPLARWRSTAREASKQARRSWFSQVSELASTADVVARIEAASLAVVLWESATRPIASVDVPTSGEILLVIGPEGSFTPEEVDAFVAAGAVSVKMGAEVLRTSTAGVAALAAVMSRTSRWA
ncbi:16S rRNA (uracil(1498)-N(3))-methyltransferase [Nocardioides sp. Kera G14]|uniref:16S rRNA (uracil(1498)-N(3))-methyltransferase n=1 Tax=Nocardioides sp. Kera G14 TaxID=2884264 RepID=UPI001D10B11C|nr:16S rRNA (uracil(1498)-N(3))-methyltransferase [Nocardioides sp. Kera G14]UDY24831.1 16S rRNA (uracil(1498)-N(3))-methyltransferase [Nocardioides sp. Kera G14]